MSGKFEPRVYQISDIVEWYEKGELNYSPKYQRNSVWNLNAKSYLIDTILRGLPIPPIFVRQKIDVSTRKTNREIIDGQQRLRAIIDFVVEENLTVLGKHSKEYGGLKYSDLPDSTKEELLQFNIIAQMITESNESLIYDMFARLNSNNVVLNKQEIRNSKYWGDFKVFINQLTSEYRVFFTDYNFFSDSDLSRMKDYEFMNSLIILITSGIITETPSFVDDYYANNDDNFENAEISRDIFQNILLIIEDYFERLDIDRLFSNKNYFYSLFAILMSVNYKNDWVGFDDINVDFLPEDFEGRLLDFTTKLLQSRSKESNLSSELKEQYQELDTLHKRRTTNRSERIDRINKMANLLGVL